MGELFFSPQLQVCVIRFFFSQLAQIVFFSAFGSPLPSGLSIFTHPVGHIVFLFKVLKISFVPVFFLPFKDCGKAFGTFFSLKADIEHELLALSVILVEAKNLLGTEEDFFSHLVVFFSCGIQAID